MQQEIILIAAMDKNRIIGINNKIPWDLPGDRRIFARRTAGGVVIMGRKTYESILAMLGKPLGNGRRSIVLTRKEGYCTPFENVRIASSWEEALAHADGPEEVFVIGGEEIYRLALPYAHRAIITQVDAECAGDAFFPELTDTEWELYAYDSHGFTRTHSRDEYPYRVVGYKRRQKPPAVDMDNARIPKQRAAMEGILARGHCPFCPGNLPPEHKQPVEKDGAHWFITKNQWPHKNTKLNLLFILKRHTETLADLKPEEGAELFELLSWTEKKYSFPGGGIGMRFGDTNFSAATVRHIHVQLFVPDRDAPDFEPVRFKIGKSKS